MLKFCLYVLMVLFVLSFVAVFITSIGCEAVSGLSPVTGGEIPGVCKVLPQTSKLVQAFLR